MAKWARRRTDLIEHRAITERRETTHDSNGFARHIGVTRATLSRIVNGHAAITPDISIRLEEALGASREMWSGMQTTYDLWQAAQKPRKRIPRIAGAEGQSV